MLIEARLTWGGDVLAVAHTKARDLVRLSDFALTGFEDDDTIVADAEKLWCDAVQRGRAIVWFALVDDAETLPFGELGEFRTTKGVILAAVLHATLLAMAFLGQAAPSDLDRLETMKAYLAASDGHAFEEASNAPAPDFGKDDTGVQTKPGEPGMAGSPMQKRTEGIHARSKGEDPAETRKNELADAREFGMVRLLTAPDPGGNAGSDPFASFEGPSAVGSIFGQTIDDAFGFGGAGLSGAGIGGGGKGAGIGFEEGGGGTCGEDCMRALSMASHLRGAGVSSGHGRLGGSHAVRQLSVSCRCGSTQVNGRLPPEAIQRVVRQNFGRMRQCYESSLLRQPTLEGRISVKFIIGRDGAVAMASANESSFSDSSVDACVVRAFQDMSFPQPEGGIVTVVYPLTFSVSS